jgi:hypothetical protein
MDVDKIMHQLQEDVALKIYEETNGLLKSGDIGKLKKEDHEFIPYLKRAFSDNGYTITEDSDHIFVTKP